VEFAKSMEQTIQSLMQRHSEEVAKVEMERLERQRWYECATHREALRDVFVSRLTCDYQNSQYILNDITTELANVARKEIDTKIKMEALKIQQQQHAQEVNTSIRDILKQQFNEFTESKMNVIYKEHTSDHKSSLGQHEKKDFSNLTNIESTVRLDVNSNEVIDFNINQQLQEDSANSQATRTPNEVIETNDKFNLSSMSNDILTTNIIEPQTSSSLEESEYSEDEFYSDIENDEPSTLILKEPTREISTKSQYKENKIQEEIPEITSLQRLNTAKTESVESTPRY
jgi:hypothetical protein